MATRLAEALGLPPDQSERFIAAGLGEVAADKMGTSRTSSALAAAPRWLTHDPSAEHHAVVGREGELARLQTHLSAALDGHGRVVFVTGEAGQGKTALLTAFAERACAAVSDLVVARGAGTTTSEFGSPYLPIHDVFSMLVADRHAPVQSDHLTREQARRLWDFARWVAEVVVDAGPHLLDVLAATDTIRERLGLSITPPSSAEASRGRVVDEVTAVLRTLSEQRPLLVTLDDMQWADSASADLLFHLTRRLNNTRILVVCAYRSSEVEATAVLRKAMLEAGRDVDDVVVDLDDIGEAAERSLCRALLDMEVSDLADSLSDEVHRRTRGHPFFVRELIRELKDGGDLVRQSDGTWMASPKLDWNRIPARVVAVIEQRLSRLTADERALLTAAAVEGEHFTVEVVARVAEVEEWRAHRLLAEELGKVHALVREVSTGRSGDQRLTRYRFGHELFQRYIYDRMSPGVRARAHGRVAAELSAVRAADIDSVLPELAHHYAEVGDAERAIPYLLQTGDRARLLYSHAEALAAYQLAADFLRQQGDTERLARALMRIGVTYQTAFDHAKAQQAFDEAFALWPAVRSSGSGKAGRSATLRLVIAEPQSLDPLFDSYSEAIASCMFSGLVGYDDGANIVPDVAERWGMSDDGRRYTFHLRDDVVWTDDRPVTADDFVFTYRRALAATGAEYAAALLAPIAGADDVREGRLPAVRAGIHAVDAHTLVIELSEPTSYFLYNLGQGALSPVPHHILQAHGELWWRPETFVSNGPFQLAAWKRGESLELELNPRYHGSVDGNVRRVSLRTANPEHADHEQLYLSDEVDVLENVLGTPPEVIDRLRRRYPTEHAVRTDGTGTYYYWVDVDAAPLDDRRLRQAMAMAVDRDALVARWYRNMSTPAIGGLVPPAIPGHVPDIAVYDPDRAARIIADVADGEMPRIVVLARRYVEPMVRQLVHDWQTAGLSMDVRLCTSVDDLDREWRSTAGPKVGLVSSIADYPDPDSFLRVEVSTALPNWHHDRYASLLDRAARTYDVTKRLELYQTCERVLAEEAVLVPLVYQPIHLMIKPWVTSFPTLPFTDMRLWKDVTIGPHDEARE